MKRASWYALLATLVCSKTIAFQGPAVMRSQRLILSMSEEAATKSDSSAPEAAEEPVKCPDCDLCDGSGRIVGGIGAVLDWWPIKAYRPCPNFIDKGGTYQRSGQGLDEIAFGRDSTFNPKDYV